MKTVPPPSGTVTFLFTDIEGSTRLWREHPAAMRETLMRHHTLLRSVIEQNGGYVSQIVGDAFHAAFTTAPAAIAAAAASQLAILAEPWGETGPLRVRMAVHVGPAELHLADLTSGQYASGLTLSRTARLLAAAHGSQVLVSAAVEALVRDQLPEGVMLRDLGSHPLRDLPNPPRLYQLVAPGLPSAFPPLTISGPQVGNLPPPLTSFVGRTQELQEVRELLAATRLLTLTGTGGIGKTRLALQTALEVQDQYPGGAWLVELASLFEPALVPGAIAGALDLRAEAGRSLLEVLLDYVRDKRLLLVLDNCEHLITGCAHAAEALLHAGPGVKLLATSREPLGIGGEQVFRVPSLALPMAGRAGPAWLLAVQNSEAGQLFLQRAKAVQPDFALNADNGADVARIVQKLDGIPLAIELAAARVRLMAPEQIAARLDDRFRLLTGGSRSALPRHQTLLAAIDWSYQLLSEAERELLRCLTVFAGGWLLDAAEEVGAGNDSNGRSSIARPDVLDLLARLVDRSLVVVESSGSGESRYRLLETIRQFGDARLLEAGEAEAVHARHLAYFRRLAETAEPLFFGPQQAQSLNRLEAEHDNLRVALTWGLEHQPEDALHLAAALRWYWQRRGYMQEGQNWLHRALERVDRLPRAKAEINPAAARDRVLSRGRALAGIALIGIYTGDHEAAPRAAQAAVEALEAVGDERELTMALGLWGSALLYAGDIPSARRALQRGEALARVLNDPVSLSFILSGLIQISGFIDHDNERTRALATEELQLGRDTGDLSLVAEALFGLGLLAIFSSDWPGARSHLSEASRLFREVGDRPFANAADSALGDVARHMGALQEAEAQYQKVAITWNEIGHRPGVARCLECLAFIARASGRIERAATLLGAAEALRERLSADMTPDEHAEYDEELAALRAQLGEQLEAFEAAWHAGRLLDADAAVALALSQPGMP